MSTGRVSDRSIKNQLIDAIRAGNMVNLREILSLEDKVGYPCLTDDDIHEALYAAAREGSVIACQLLWGKLSWRGKRMYFAMSVSRWNAPLHVAARYGRLDVVRLFVKEFKWNVNQKNCMGETPLCIAVQRLEMARFLLENGANVNQVQGRDFGPLCFAVSANNTEVARLLLVEYQANPNLNRRPADEEDTNQQQYLRNTDFAIKNGNAEILRMLLEHGAFVGHLIIDASSGTALNVLLCKQQTSHETKLTICHILLEHAKEDHSTTTFMQASFEFAIKQTDNVVCQILLEAGMNPSSRWAWDCAIQEGNEPVCHLLGRYGADPFSEDENEDEEHAANSPFLAAARQSDTRIFEYLLDLWNERFSTTGGKNSDGDYPLHVACCDPCVSLQAIKVLVSRQADALAVIDGEQGLLPLHFAANWGASLDVIFYLLQHCPDALRHGGNAAAIGQRSQLASTIVGDTTNESTLECSTYNNDDIQACGPVKKKAKRTH